MWNLKYDSNELIYKTETDSQTYKTNLCGYRRGKVVVVQSPSCVQLFVTPWTAVNQAFLSLTISQSLHKFMSITLVMPSSHLILWCPLLLPSIFSSIRDFPMSQLLESDDQNTGASALASVLPTSIQGWFPLRLTGLISLLSKGPSGVFSSTTVWRHQFFGVLQNLFMVQLSQPYVTTGETIALTIWTFVSSLDYVDLLFSTLSRFVIAFLPRSNHLLIFMAAVTICLVPVILETKKRRSVTASTFSPSICHEVLGPEAMILVF